MAPVPTAPTGHMDLTPGITGSLGRDELLLVLFGGKMGFETTVQTFRVNADEQELVPTV